MPGPAPLGANCDCATGVRLVPSAISEASCTQHVTDLYELPLASKASRAYWYGTPGSTSRPPTCKYPAVRESLPELEPWMAWVNDGYDCDVCEQGVRKALVKFVFVAGFALHIIDRSDGRNCRYRQIAR
jgi:hypothetical protein